MVDQASVSLKRYEVTPLLFLLDGVLSQDEDRVKEAVLEMQRLGCMTSPPTKCPSRSSDSLLSVLSSYLDKYPQSAAIKSDHDDSLPIHFAASLGSIKIAKLILDKFPQGALCPNKKGKIALHYAAREGHATMVDFLLSAAPQTAAMATDKGKLAIHFAAGEGHLPVVASLLRIYPKSASLSTSKGKVALHFSARWGNVEVSRLLLSVFPDGIRALDWEGSLPLHDAAREGQVQMAQFLIERFPESLRVANIRSEIPLFPAVQSQNMELVVLMLTCWPAGGKYVLQNVSENDNIWPWEFVELLLRGATRALAGHRRVESLRFSVPPQCVLDYDVPPTQFIGEHNMQEARLVDRVTDGMILPKRMPTFSPMQSERPSRSKSPVLLESATKESRKSRKRKRASASERSTSSPEFLALHAAFQSKVSPFVLRKVLTECPDDLSRRDSFGRYPLHYAVTHAAPLVVAMVTSRENGLITEASSSAVDSNGKIPLHIAIENKAPIEIIKSILEVCPSCAITPSLCKDECNGLLPSQMAILRQCDTSTIFELIRADPMFVERFGKGESSCVERT